MSDVPISAFFFHFFFFNDTATTEIYTLSLHDALPIYESIAESSVDTLGVCSSGWRAGNSARLRNQTGRRRSRRTNRSEEHTSELQSPCNLVCRLLLEKKKPWHLARRQDPV